MDSPRVVQMDDRKAGSLGYLMDLRLVGLMVHMKVAVMALEGVALKV